MSPMWILLGMVFLLFLIIFNAIKEANRLNLGAKKKRWTTKKINGLKKTHGGS